MARPARPAQARRIVLMRHAKSAWPSGVPDHERPLAGKGRRNAQAAGRWLADEGPQIDLVLCSDAVRAAQTWEIVRGCLSSPPETRMEPRLYGTDAEGLLALVRVVDADLGTLLVVGHEPTMSATTLLLSGDGSDRGSVRQAATKFPTGAIAVLRFSRPWRELAAGRAVLETLAVPRV